MIRAVIVDGHWRVVDDVDRRYMPNDTNEDGAVGGSFVSRSATTDHDWSVGTRLDERAALLLAGVLRALYNEYQERARRVLLTCDPCRAKIRTST